MAIDTTFSLRAVEGLLKLSVIDILGQMTFCRGAVLFTVGSLAASLYLLYLLGPPSILCFEPQISH